MAQQDFVTIQTFEQVTGRQPAPGEWEFVDDYPAREVTNERD